MLNSMWRWTKKSQLCSLIHERMKVERSKIKGFKMYSLFGWRKISKSDDAASMNEWMMKKASTFRLFSCISSDEIYWRHTNWVIIFYSSQVNVNNHICSIFILCNTQVNAAVYTVWWIHSHRHVCHFVYTQSFDSWNTLKQKGYTSYC